MSLSSGDDEFFALRNLLIGGGGTELSRYQAGKIPDITGRLWGSDFRIARNGFPINFDNSRESAPLEMIQGTMAALTGALCQSHRFLLEGRYSGAGRFVLDLGFQQWLLGQWSRVLPFSPPAGRRQRGPAALPDQLVEFGSADAERLPRFLDGDGDGVHGRSPCRQDAGERPRTTTSATMESLEKK
jgi:hypothetical protein